MALASPQEIVDLMGDLRDALVAAGAKPNGGVSPTDPDWGDDISELIARSSPHEIFDSAGVPTTVHIKLDTLRAEVDGNNEVCAWIYEES